MAEQEGLQGPQLAAVEAQLHALLRSQAKHALPVDLPRPDFWHVCSQLLQSIEMELAEISRLEGFSARAQTLSRRQANLRRTLSDLTRHRLQFHIVTPIFHVLQQIVIIRHLFVDIETRQIVSEKFDKIDQ